MNKKTNICIDHDDEERVINFLTIHRYIPEQDSKRHEKNHYRMRSKADKLSGNDQCRNSLKQKAASPSYRKTKKSFWSGIASNCIKKVQIIIITLLLLANNNTSLCTTRSKPLAWWTRQLANSANLARRKTSSRWWEGKELFYSAESFGAGAMLQRCLVTWHLASHWLMICTQLCSILIFKLPR